MWPTLYRRSLDGIEIWSIKVEGNLIRVNWGKLNGKQTERTTPITEGKNLDKSNATTSYLQAEKEAQSKWTKKVKREGYYSLEMLGYEPMYVGGTDLITKDKKPTITTYYLPVNKIEKLNPRPLTLNEVLLMLPAIGTTNEGKTLPMLAKSFYVEKKGLQVPRLPFPMLVQPKLNGVRAIMKVTNDRVRFWSREGIEYVLPDLSAKIQKQLDRLITVNDESVMLDGELYIPDTILADIVSAVKKPNLNTHMIKFWCYDLCEENMKQMDRLRCIKNMDIDGIVIVKTYKVDNVNEVEMYCDKFIDEGFEGLIARNPLAFYQFGARTSDLLKLKRRQSGEFKIVDVYDTPKQPRLAMFKCLNDINREYFEVVPQGTHIQRRHYLEDRTEIIGKMLTVEYYERTDKPKEVPFHAVGIVIRDYE